MRFRLRPKLSYSNVIASIALFVALGGAAVAAGLPRHSVGPNQLKRGAVTSAAIRRAAVTSGKLAPKSVVNGKLGPNAVLPGNIGNGAITSAKIGAGAVIARSIKNNVVTTNKLNNNAVTTAKLAPNSVTTANLVNGSVTPAKLSTEIGGTVSTLKTGQTLRGVFVVGPSGDKISRFSESFPMPLANTPAAPKANVLEIGATSTACPGITGGNAATPQAAAGQLCVYITSKAGETLEGLEFDPAATNRLGFGLSAGFLAPSVENVVRGFWAVTAP
jgi:hypothetical protein